MLVAAHQPHYLPWLGYFDRIRKADLFVVVDHVQFERQNYQNRTRIRTGQGVRWLTVPVFQRSRSERIVDKEINNLRAGRLRWGRKSWRTLELAYHRAPYFSLYGPAFREILDRRWERLVDLNLELLQLCLETLEIRTPLLRSTALELSGRKSEMVLNLCRAVDAAGFLAGMGASRQYLDVESFQEAGIQIVWQQFQHPGYPQHTHQGPFVAGLSVLDLLFNCGPASGRVLRGETPAIAKAA